MKKLSALFLLFFCATASAQTLIPTGGSGGTPGGSDTQCQYNNAGAFGGITGCTTNGTAVTLVAPVLGTPASGTLTNTTGFPVANLAGAGTGVLTALAINVGSAGAPVLFNGALGTPSSGVATNLTGTASGLTAGAVAVGGITGLGTGVATFLATPSSANLLAAVTDETGTGALTFANTPTLVTPVLGVATATSVTASGLLQAGTTIGISTDVLLNRDAANTLALRNSTNAQTFNVYNTYTDASNYERLSLAWNTSVATISTSIAGTGTERKFQFATGNTALATTYSPFNFTSGLTPSANKSLINLVDTAHVASNAAVSVGLSGFGSDIGSGNTGRVWAFGPDGGSRQLDIWFDQNGPISFSTNGTQNWDITAAGYLLAHTDNTFDIGASGGTSPRAVYSATSLITAGYGMFGSRTALTLTAGAIGMSKITASASAPGAAGGKLELVCGTNAGTAKLVAYAGTSGTAVTVVDNIGTGVTGC